MTRTVWCKGCQKLEQTDRPINLLNCAKRTVDGIEYLALYLHARPDGKAEDFGGIPAIQMWSLGRRG